ncbi:hypothetical protein ZHAS_00007015 [Anopheles sinensis]|uniref:Uncharacterized protein n=1 Tax=Anopheles sinensis TaxID=74873 RepID=A0A084VNN5_ANOSI|nr:hypothetical protein ZHAS_00007015 [Anopheles sinensis]
MPPWRCLVHASARRKSRSVVARYLRTSFFDTAPEVWGPGVPLLPGYASGADEAFVKRDFLSPASRRTLISAYHKRAARYASQPLAGSGS